MGTLKLWASSTGLRRLDFQTGPDLVRSDETLSLDAPPAHLARALEELRAFFRGELATFRLPLDLAHVTPFQARVYDRLRAIPRGRVMTYGAVARELGEGPGAARAVGQAVGANPVAIVIPCHRVVASDGSLHGYGGGLARKAALLRLEGVAVDGAAPTSKVHPERLRLPL